MNETTAPTFATRDEAIFHCITEPINAGDANAATFDIDAIADAVLDTDDAGRWFQAVDADEFWQVVAANEVPVRILWTRATDDEDAAHLQARIGGEWVDVEDGEPVEFVTASEDEADYAAAEDALLARYSLTRENVTIESEF